MQNVGNFIMSLLLLAAIIAFGKACTHEWDAKRKEKKRRQQRNWKKIDKPQQWPFKWLDN